MALSNFEISKTLTVSDITDKKVALPVSIMEHMGENSVELTVFDIWGKQFQLKYYTRPNGRPCPVLRWQKYVIDKDVLAGDEFIFSRQQVAGADGVPEMQYMIQVKRQTRTLNGKPVTVEVVKSLTSMTFQGKAM